MGFWAVLCNGLSPLSDREQVLFFSTSLPLDCTWWVRSTFSSRCSVSSKQHCWLISATPTSFYLKIALGMLGIKSRAVWSGGKYVNHCDILHPNPELFEQLFIWTFGSKPKSKILHLLHQLSLSVWFFIYRNLQLFTKHLHLMHLLKLVDLFSVKSTLVNQN